MAVSVRADDGTLVVRMTRVDMIASMRRRIALPITAVTGVRPLSLELADADRPLFRAPGTYWGRRGIIAGTYHGRGEAPQFWCVRNAEEVLSIDLTGGEISRGLGRIVVAVDDPLGTSRAIAKRVFR